MKNPLFCLHVPQRQELINQFCYFISSVFYGHKTLGTSRVWSSFPHSIHSPTLLSGFSATQEQVPRMLLNPVCSPWLQINIYPGSLIHPQLNIPVFKVIIHSQACSLPAYCVWHGPTSCQSASLGVFSKSSFIPSPSHSHSQLSPGLALFLIPTALPRYWAFCLARCVTVSR